MTGNFLKTFAAIAVVTTAAAGAFGLKAVAAEAPYERIKAYKSIINPHEQINDEGEVMLGRCIICHKNVPDKKKEKSLKDVKLRYDEDLKDLCFKCHPTKKHPGAKGSISAMMSGFAAPDHLVKPPKEQYLNLRLTKKEIYTNLPLDPATGKITCVTCHNPHEKGVLSGRPDWGADSEMRLRTEGLDICQYCHRK